MKGRITVAMAMVLSTFALVQSVSAATLGGIASDVLTASTNTTRAIIAFDQFTGTAGTALGGTLTDIPPLPYATPWTTYTWVDSGGTWRYDGTGTRARCAASTPLGELGFATTSNEHTVAARVRRTTAAYNAGISLNDSGPTSLVVRVRTNTTTTSFLELQIYNAGFVTLASVSVPIATNYDLRAESYGTTAAGTVVVFLNGVLRINHTLSAANAAIVHGASAVGVGMICTSDTSSTLDLFHADV